MTRDRDAAGRPRQARPRDALGRPLPYGHPDGVEPVPEEALPPGPALAAAQELLSGGRPFAAHEVLEAVWKAAPDAERDLWQGLAQLCVALTHARRGNGVGATRLLGRAAVRLRPYAGTAPHGVDVAGLLAWCAASAADPAPAVPLLRGAAGGRLPADTRAVPGGPVTLPSTEAELAELAAQEERLVFPRFDADVAWALGVRLTEAARAAGLPVVVSISAGGQRLFHAALPGTAPDNDSWVERKARVVLRFRHSSLHVGTQARVAGSTFEERSGLPAGEYAAHGGSFPITVAGAGVIGTVTVSGLPQVDDHAFVVAQVEGFLRG